MGSGSMRKRGTTGKAYWRWETAFPLNTNYGGDLRRVESKMVCSANIPAVIVNIIGRPFSIIQLKIECACSTQGR